jgi:hypothetical protein
MALIINGTTGISGIDGSASAPALQGTDSNTGINFGSDILGFSTGGTERSRFDSNGNLLIGNTSHNNGGFGGNSRGINIAGIQPQILLHETDTDKDAYFGVSGSQAWFYSADSIPLKFGTADTERMRVTSGGSLCIGVDTTANSEKLRVDSTGSTGTVFLRHGSTDDVGMMIMRHSRNTGGTAAGYIKFQDAGGTVRGFIDATTSGTTYSTSSDYRLKENITAISDGITRLKTLKPSKFNFIGDSRIVDGFLAHEVTAVPEAITGTKDEVDADKNPVYQGIDQSKLVPLLTAALQEAVAKIEVLETKVAALEAA